MKTNVTIKPIVIGAAKSVAQAVLISLSLRWVAQVRRTIRNWQAAGK